MRRGCKECRNIVIIPSYSKFFNRQTPTGFVAWVTGNIVNKVSTFICLFLFVTLDNAESASHESVSKPGRPTIELLQEGEIETQSEESGNQVEELVCREDRVHTLLNNGHRVGFGRNTTGGADAAAITTVTSLADSGPGTLREAISGGGPVWVVFDKSIYGGTIFLDSPLRPPRNTTIDGRGIGMMAGITLAVTEKATHAMLIREGNVLIHGITIDGNNTGATGVMLRTGDDYWLDHVTITGFSKDDALAVGQGSQPDSTSEVTISNYHVYESDKGFLAGGELSYFDTYRTHRVTIFNSLLNARDRNPHISVKGRTHIFNNLIIPTAWTGIDIRHAAIAIVENNVISGESTNVANSVVIGWSLPSSGRPTGHVILENNEFTNGAGSEGSINPDSVGRSDIPYEYSLIDTNLVEDHVKRNAGAENASFDIMVCD